MMMMMNMLGEVLNKEELSMSSVRGHELQPVADNPSHGGALGYLWNEPPLGESTGCYRAAAPAEQSGENNV